MADMPLIPPNPFFQVDTLLYAELLCTGIMYKTSKIYLNIKKKLKRVKKHD